MTVLIRAVLSLVVCVLAGGWSADAQTAQRSALIGQVTDPSGAPLVGARVTLSGAASTKGPRLPRVAAGLCPAVCASDKVPTPTRSWCDV